LNARPCRLGFGLPLVVALLGGCPLGAPTIGGHPIVCQNDHDCGPGTACDFSQGRGLCLAVPDAGPDGGMDSGYPDASVACAVDGTTCAFDGGNVCLGSQCVSGCALDGGVVLLGSVDAQSGCASCQPAQSATSYTPLGDGTPCQNDGGNVCLGARCVAACIINGQIVRAHALSRLDVGQCCNVTADAGAWSPAFVKGQTITTANPPLRIATADFNGDGKLDLAVAEEGTQAQVGVFLGDGTGHFGSESLINTGAVAIDLALGDYNGDGFSDIAVLQANARVAILKNQGGDGGFGDAGSFPSPSTPTAIVSANLYSDGGPLDLAMTGTNVVGVAANGNFGFFIPYPVGGKPVALTHGDLNGNGVQDLAAANSQNEAVSILLNQGNGTFVLTSTVGLGGIPSAICSLARPDRAGLAVSIANIADAGSVATVDRLPDSGFGVTASIPVGPSPSAIAAADFNGDSLPDLAVVDSSESKLRVLFGGDAGFTVDAYTEGPGVAVAVGDFNGDGRPDLAVANGDSTVTIFLGQCP
jgi:hypothetical protein